MAESGTQPKWYCAKCLQSWLEWNPGYTIVDTPDHIPLSNETIARTGLRQWNESYIATCEHQGHIFAIMEVTWQITSQTHGFFGRGFQVSKTISHRTFTTHLGHPEEGLKTQQTKAAQQTMGYAYVLRGPQQAAVCIFKQLGTLSDGHHDANAYVCSASNPP